MAFMAVPDSVRAQAQTIRDQAEADYARIRSNGRLSVDAIRADMAAAYLKASTAMSELQQATNTNTDAQIRAATSAVWGINDLATDPATRAAVSLSYRDAQERADAIPPDRPQDAVTLMQRAEDSGDEVLARAVAKRAYDCGGLGQWGDVLTGYLSTRPRADAALTHLQNLAVRRPKAADLFAFVLTKPPELANVDDWQMPALAEQAQ